MTLKWRHQATKDTSTYGTPKICASSRNSFMSTEVSTTSMSLTMYDNQLLLHMSGRSTVVQAIAVCYTHQLIFLSTSELNVLKSVSLPNEHIIATADSDHHPVICLWSNKAPSLAIFMASYGNYVWSIIGILVVVFVSSTVRKTEVFAHCMAHWKRLRYGMVLDQ